MQASVKITSIYSYYIYSALFHYVKDSDSQCNINLFFNVCNSFSQGFLHTQVALTGNHDTLCLRRTCTVHGFCTITNSCRAEAEVFVEALDFETIFCRYIIDAAEVFINVRPNLRITEVFFRRCCNHQATSNIFG